MTLKKLIDIIVILAALQLCGKLFAQSGGDLYQSVISQADTYFSGGDLINAKASYQYASRLNPEAEYPKDKLKETLNKLRAKIAVVDQYTAVVSKADSLFRVNDFEAAKQKYSEAANIMPDETYPGNQIAEMEKVKRDREMKQANYDEAVVNGDKFIKFHKYEKAREEFVTASDLFPMQTYPKERITELDSLIEITSKVLATYNETITSADRLFNLKYYENARDEYQKAADAKPDEDYPAMRIKEIDDILVKKTEYDQYIAQADEFYGNKNLEEAKTKYQAGLTIYPSENYPKDMIGKINESMRSKGNNEEIYSKSVAAADKFFAAKDNTNAILEYENAAAAKPSESYPKQKIEEVNELIKKAESDVLEFNGAVQRGEKYLANEYYKEAKEEFEKALKLKPNEVYLKEKLKEINQKLTEQNAQQESYDQMIVEGDKLFNEGKYEEAKAAYQKALKIKPDEKYPADRIAEIETILSKSQSENNEYAGALSNADALFGEKKYEEANLAYMKASYIKPKEQYPKDRMIEIDSLIMAEKGLLAEYNKNIAAGDRWMELKDYDKAKEKYNEALKISPEEKYPRDKLTEIENIVVSNELSTQDNYNSLIETGDALFSKKLYEQAKIKYQNALKYKSQESYPAQKLIEIDSLVKNLESLQAKYSVIIAEADLLFSSKKYQEAKTKYIAASAVLPDEEYPKGKIEEINLHFKNNNQQNQQAYDKAIADADKFFASGILDQALDAYRNARNLSPGETYPDEMIGRILKKLDENAIRDLLPAAITLENNAEKKLTFEPLTVSDRKSSYLYIKVKNMSEKDFKIILSFGKGSGKNGGFVLPVPNQAEEKEFIIPIGKQYTWFSQDNDWISVITQGGKVEITTGKISKAD
jgi:tetratricopeptide (TPR) repeat protein